MSMQIHVNGESTVLSGPMSLSDALAQLNNLPENYAIAVNTNFVPRSSYDNTRIEAGDQLELLVPMQGG